MKPLLRLEYAEHAASVVPARLHPRFAVLQAQSVSGLGQKSNGTYYVDVCVPSKRSVLLPSAKTNGKSNARLHDGVVWGAQNTVYVVSEASCHTTESATLS